jgi:hypothetical protein
MGCTPPSSKAQRMSIRSNLSRYLRRLLGGTEGGRRNKRRSDGCGGVTVGRTWLRRLRKSEVRSGLGGVGPGRRDVFCGAAWRGCDFRKLCRRQRRWGSDSHKRWLMMAGRKRFVSKLKHEISPSCDPLLHSRRKRSLTATRGSGAPCSSGP